MARIVSRRVHHEKETDRKLHANLYLDLLQKTSSGFIDINPLISLIPLGSKKFNQDKDLSCFTCRKTGASGESTGTYEAFTGPCMQEDRYRRESLRE